MMPPETYHANLGTITINGEEFPLVVDFEIQIQRADLAPYAISKDALLGALCIEATVHFEEDLWLWVVRSAGGLEAWYRITGAIP